MIINQIKENFQGAQEVPGDCISDPETLEKIEKAGELLGQALKPGNKIISCGHGGSMCEDLHFVRELTVRFRTDRRPLSAIAIDSA